MQPEASFGEDADQTLIYGVDRNCRAPAPRVDGMDASRDAGDVKIEATVTAP